MNHHHSKHQALVLVVVVLVVVQAATSHHHSTAVVDMVVMLPSLLVELSVQVDHHTNQYHQALKYSNMLLMLKVSTLIKTHKSSAAQLLVVYKHTHKTFEFASFNHHLFHPQG
jgi:hypothetical protein